MKIVLLEFNKSNTTSIDEFSDLVQKTLNENNDLLEFKSYELAATGNIRVELLLGDKKTMLHEVIAYGPNLTDDLLTQMNATLLIAEQQNKSVKHACIVPLSKSRRAVGFLVLTKGADNKGTNESVEVQETEERNKDKTANEKSTRRRKAAS
jgi:carbonic anhydrase/acetyltransferase-like protein (isoleucine patch superfamily)